MFSIGTASTYINQDTIKSYMIPNIENIGHISYIVLDLDTLLQLSTLLLFKHNGILFFYLQ